MEAQKLVGRVLIDNRKRAAKRAQVRACFTNQHWCEALLMPLISEVYIHKFTKMHIHNFNKIKKIIIMKKQSVKKWIKGFFPTNQKKPTVITFQSQKMEKKVEQKEQNWTQAQAQIVNQLINMDSIIKISKQIHEYQYVMLNKINQILCQEDIDLVLVRKCLVGGLEIMNQKRDTKYTTKQLPYQYYSVRSLLWKVSGGYLTYSSKSKWISSMEKSLASYRKYIYQFIVQPIQKKLGLSGLNNPLQFKKPDKNVLQQKIKDHPLNFSQQSKWANYFKDVQLWKLIQKDTKRTRKNCKFFQEQNKLELQNDEVLLRPEQITFSDKPQQTYADSLTRIIFIYLKNHPNQCYCQGMNELAALIYYCFTNKNSEYFRRVSESDTYYFFQMIMMGRLPKKHFQKGQEYVKQFTHLLKKVDLRLYEQIQKNKGIEMIKLFTMKWFISGFLTQFNIDQSLLIWDTFITWPCQNFLLTECFTYMALSLVHLNRSKIMEGQNLSVIFSKISNSPSQLSQKTQSLYKLFPKILQK